MTIQEVSDITGLSKYTLRYYEKIGLLDKVEKNTSNYRVYNEKDLTRIEFIINMRNAGIGMDKLKQYVDLASKGDESVEQRRKILINNQREIEEQIKSLKKCSEYLNYKIENYDSIIKNKNI